MLHKQKENGLFYGGYAHSAGLAIYARLNLRSMFIVAEQMDEKWTKIIRILKELKYFNMFQTIFFIVLKVDKEFIQM